MKPSIIVSSSDLERLEGLLTLPAFRSRSDLDGLREELERADVREPQDMPADVITMNSKSLRNRNPLAEFPTRRQNPSTKPLSSIA